MSQSEMFLDEYNLDSLRLIQPVGQDFQMYVTPRYESHYLLNEYERMTARFFSRLAVKADVFVDVGAHSGFFSLLAAKSNPGAKIVSVEPTPASCEILRRNVDRLGSANIEVCQAAVSAKSGTKTFLVSAASDSNSFYEHPNAPVIDRIQVETVSIDALLKDQSAKRIIIKIDTDGHELSVLSGMSETLKRADDIRLIVEFNPKMQIKAGYQPVDLLNELDRLGFALFLIDEDSGNFSRLLPNSDWPLMMDVASYANIYCVKQSQALNVVFFAHSAGLAGAERSLLELVDELIVDYGVVCTVVVPGEGPLVQAFERAGAALIVNNRLDQWSRSLISISENVHDRLIDGCRALTGDILPLLQRLDPDIIFTQTMTIPWGAAAAALLTKPHIWSVCEFGKLDHGLEFLDSLGDVCDAIEKGSSFVLTVSDAVRELLFPNLMSDKVRTVYRHISIPPELTAQSKKRIESNGRVRLAVVGTLSEGKGQIDAVRAVEKLVKSGFEVELSLVGYKNPAYYSKLLALIHELNLEDRVRIGDFSDDPYSIILKSDILLVCSRNEALGRVVIEGMLLGRPIVYSRSGGIPEYMEDGTTGLSYAPSDSQELAQRIAEYIQNPEMTARIVENAKHHAEAKFSRDAYGGEIIRLMQKIRQASNVAAVTMPARIVSSMASALQQSEIKVAKINDHIGDGPSPHSLLLEELGQRVISLEAAIEERDETIEGQRSLIDAYGTEFSDLQNRLAKSVEDAAQAAQAANNIRTITSWRMTDPIWVRSILDRTGVTDAARKLYRKLPISHQTRVAVRKILSRFVGGPKESKAIDPGKLRQGNVVSGSEKTLLLNMFAKASPVGINTEYVPLLDESIDFSRSPLRLIAFYLPQFHPIPENDAWWGKGFTEWTNVSKATPQYIGHNQPRLPGELGYYDLRVEDVQKRQIELARRYGIHGFCYHHYWFGGRRLLERPLKQILNNKDLDLPFCICWANENWTRRWDGQDQEILIAQNHSPEDDIAFIEDVADVLRDQRYIRFNGKPVLIVYRVSLLPDAKATAQRWREYCRDAGIGEIYLVAARSFEVTDPRPYGFDAAIEFPPHQSSAARMNDKLEIVNPDFQGNVYDFAGLVEWYKAQKISKYPLIKTVTPGWDNEARRPGRGHSFHGASPVLYADWLRSAAQFTLDRLKADPQHPNFVFVNAWNEWAEGAYLEPDRQLGYAYLHATANILRDISPVHEEVTRMVEQSQRVFKKSSDTAIIAHLHYVDLSDELIEYIKCAKDSDVFLSLNPSIQPGDLNRIASALPFCRFALFPNRGRDIYPFLDTMKLITEMKYEFACKVHAKKSLQRTDGQALRQGALRDLLGSETAVREIIQRFRADSTLGIITPANSLLDLSQPNRNVLNRVWLDRLLPRLGLKHLVGNYRCTFSAGSMFWFRVDSLEAITKLSLNLSDFEEELGQVDGTLAHALERVMVASATNRGFGCEDAYLDPNSISDIKRDEVIERSR